MIDFDAITTKFIRIAQQRVGSSLSKSGPLGDEPNVIRSRPSKASSTPPTPDYPYITVDVIDVTEGGNWQTDEYINESGHTVHSSIKTLSVRYRCHGDGSNAIINNLHACFDFHSVRDDLRGSLGVGIVMTTDIDSLPTVLSTKYLESSAFNVLINIVDSQIDTQSTTIDEIGLNT